MTDDPTTLDPFRAQAAVLSALLTVVATLTGALAKSGKLDPHAFGVILDQLAAQTREADPRVQALNDSVLNMFKGIVKEEAPGE